MKTSHTFHTIDIQSVYVLNKCLFYDKTFLIYKNLISGL